MSLNIEILLVNIQITLNSFDAVINTNGNLNSNRIVLQQVALEYSSSQFLFLRWK